GGGPLAKGVDVGDPGGDQEVLVQVDGDHASSVRMAGNSAQHTTAASGRARPVAPSPASEMQTPAGASAGGGEGGGPGEEPRPLLLFPGLLADRLGLGGADEPVAVGVDLPDLLVGAEELLARHVAVLVAVHLAEPQRPRRALRPRRAAHAV